MYVTAVPYLQACRVLGGGQIVWGGQQRRRCWGLKEGRSPRAWSCCLRAAVVLHLVPVCSGVGVVGPCPTLFLG